MIVLDSPKGWTGPKVVDGLPVEGTFRSHQVPLSDPAHAPRAPAAARGLAAQLPAARSCSTTHGRLRPELAELAPAGTRRMGANPHANGGLLLRELRLPDFRDYAVEVPRARRARHRRHARARAASCATSMQLNERAAQLPRLRPGRDASPTASRRVFEATERQWDAATARRTTSTWRPTGRVMEMLSEHQCEGWLEGYLLTGRHGLFNCYEAFIHIVDSMFNQHAKWLKVTRAAAVAATDRLAQLPARLARLAPGPQRLHPPGSRASSTTSSTRRPRSCASTCRPMRTACCR